MIEWNITAEAISMIVVAILLVYSFSNQNLRTYKSIVFNACLIVTFLAIMFDIVSVFSIQNYKILPIPFTYIVTLFYFLLTPLMSVMFCIYSLTLAYEGHPHLKKIMAFILIPYLIYAAFVFLNPLTHGIFTLDAVNGYARASISFSNYLIFYIYCGMGILFVLSNRKSISFLNRIVLYIYPVIAVIVVFIEQMQPVYVLTGTAAMCALLIIYLYLQNVRISIDQLTGLFNRSMLLKKLELHIKQNTPMSILVVSLRDFKFINDKFGQDQGDLFLKKIANYLTDTISHHTVYRYSGDEFAIVLVNYDKKQLADVLNTLALRFNLLWKIENNSCKIQAKICVAQFPLSVTTLSETVNSLEYALQKNTISNSIIFCNQEITHTINRKHLVANIMKDKIESNGFDVNYQCIFNTDKNRFIMAEALMRLHDDILGEISPDEFIPIAEQSGIIVAASYQLIEKVCIFIKKLLDKGIHFDGISINLSAVQFMQSDLFDNIIKIIRKYDVPPKKIKFEITESMMTSNYLEVTEFMDKMRSLGTLFALDDFGTGYSNFYHIVDLPFDYIKLDKSLITKSMTSTKTAIFFESIVSTLKNMGLDVISEGVETQKQLDFAKYCHCDYIQGYYYSRPVGEQSVETLFSIK